MWPFKKKIEQLQLLDNSKMENDIHNLKMEIMNMKKQDEALRKAINLLAKSYNNRHKSLFESIFGE